MLLRTADDKGDAATAAVLEVIYESDSTYV